MPRKKNSTKSSEACLTVFIVFPIKAVWFIFVAIIKVCVAILTLIWKAIRATWVYFNATPQRRQVGLISLASITLIGMCIFCFSSVVSVLSRTPTPTIDVAATQTRAARQTETARPTRTLTPTLTLTPTTTYTPGPTGTITQTSTVTHTRTATLPPSATARPSATPQPIIVAPTSKSGGNCNPAYPGLCLTHEVDCTDIPYKRFQVLPPDPYGLDRDGDGIGCES